MEHNILLGSSNYIFYDETSNDFVSWDDYKESRQKISKQDPDAHFVRMIDKDRLVYNENRVVGYRGIDQGKVFLFPGESLPEDYEVRPSAPKEYPTSISDEVFENKVTKNDTPQNIESTPLAPQEPDLSDPDLFVNLVGSKEKAPIKIKPIFPGMLSFDSSYKDDDEVFIKVTEQARKIKALRKKIADNNKRLQISSIISEFRSDDDKRITNDDAVIDSIIYEAKQGSFDISKEEKPKQKPNLPRRTHERRNVPINKVLAIALSAGIAFTSLTLAKNAVVESNWYQNISENIEMTSMQKVMRENGAPFNFINPNKITIPGSFDAYGAPMYWIDVDRVAKDILNQGDERFAAALYYAYYDMGDERTVGDNYNWDGVIASLGYYANNETNPMAFNMMGDCHSFNAFLIKNNFVNEDGTPSPEKFEEYGKDALKAYVESLEENASYGGR